MTRRLLTLCLLLSPLCLRAAPGFAELARLADSPNELRGEFRQQKYLAALDTSLSSSGIFSYTRDATIRWEILEPIRNQLIITPDGLSSRQGDDELLRLDAASNPGAALLGELLFAVLSADWQRLERHFEVDAEIAAPGWSAHLRPRDAGIAQLFERVELRGERLLQSIVLYEQGGDVTTIQLDAAQE